MHGKEDKMKYGEMSQQGNDFNNEFSDWKEECGVFGIYAPNLDVARYTYFGLYALQHRGQESAGIAVADGEKIMIHKGMGLVSQIFGRKTLDGLQGKIAVGHVRYSTTGASMLMNAQPILVNYSRGMMALAHNGNLVNTRQLRYELEEGGAIFQSTIDSEVIASLIARTGKQKIEEGLMEAIKHIKGAYALVIATENKLVAMRDPHGWRPLCLGKVDGGYVVSSESCAFDTIGAELIREVKPGEIIVIDDEGLKSIQTPVPDHPSLCVFEFVYFARPDSTIDGQNVQLAREAMGRRLAQEHPTDIDLVIPVPDSGIPAALGFSQESGVPLSMALIKNRYVGRTFIQPEQKMRERAVSVKLNPIRALVEGKRVALVDDSIVRGTTSKKIVDMFRRAGAKEVHFYVSSPPVAYPCFYGIDTSARSELIASSHSVEETCKAIGADGLYYLSTEGMVAAINEVPSNHFCLACFDGHYPVEIPRLGHPQKLGIEETRAKVDTR